MWDSIFKPAVVLFLICAIIAGSLAFVNDITKDVIELNTQAEQDAFRKQALESAERFEKLTQDNLPVEIVDAYCGYQGDTLQGYVFGVQSKGYGGTISMIIGVTSEGKVNKVIIGSHNETPGLGSKASDPGFIGQYDLAQAGDLLVVTKQNKKQNTEISAISGATVTSRGVTKGVQAALDAAKILLEGGK